MYHICILTDDAHLTTTNATGLLANVQLEDRLLAQALEDLGLKVSRKSWSDPYFDWGQCQGLVIRSTWDYMDRFEEFTKWLAQIPKNVQLFNSRETVSWNTDKRYLFDLEKKGVPVCPSVLVPQGNQKALKDWVLEHQWDEFVLKPCISAGGRHTYRITAEEINQYAALFLELSAQEDFLLQPFQQHILSHGEISLMYFGGQYSHAVIKKAQAGEFRVQDNFGGIVVEYHPDWEVIAIGETILQACPEMPLYARVDLIWENAGHWVLSEVELVEPELWFRHRPVAATALAQLIYGRLS
jgi:glutathione synthase/RimK-type ligase-like ATP-grasp enzyme